MSGISEKRKRRWWEKGLMALPAIIVLTPLLALMVVGSSKGPSYAHAGGVQATWEPFEHGWPFLFLTRNVYLRPASRWAIWQGGMEWNPVGVVGNAVFLVAAMAVATLLSVRRARQNRIWRLTIRECMTITLLIAVVTAHFGWYVRRGEHARAVGKRLESLRAYVSYVYCGPTWFLRLQFCLDNFSPDVLPMESIVVVDLAAVQRADMDSACSSLAEVDCPREVYMESIETNEPILHLVLESLTKCRPEELSLRYLKLEGFMGEPWSPELLEPLTRNPRLQRLDLEGTGVGDQELAAILKCRQLRIIRLRFTKVTEKGVQTLLALPELEELALSEEAVDDELRAQAAAAGVKLEVEERSPYSSPRMNPGSGVFGAESGDPAEGKTK